MKLTKTDFILYRECPNNVWVKLHEPKEYAKFEISEFERSLAVMGNEVERLARGMFPNGVMVDSRGPEAEEFTRKLISDRTPVIFQAVFTTDKYLAAADVLQWNNEVGAYDLYEIKMSSTLVRGEFGEDEEEEEDDKPKRVNKKKELQYEYDVAFQSNVIQTCGIPINKKFLIRLNKKYVKAGALDFSPNQLFIVEDKTEAVNNLMSTALLEMNTAYDCLCVPKAPLAPCPCYYKGRSSHCTAFKYINPHVPAYSVHDLNRIGLSKKYLSELLEEGVITIDQVPEDDRLKPKKPKKGEDPSLPRKLNQVRVYKLQNSIVNIEAIRTELNSLKFPLYFLDYETYPTAIPLFDGYRPYQHIVFQYSLHVLSEEDAKNGLAPKHFDCLLLEGDPADRLVQSLRTNIGDNGSVISWYKPFENSRNKELARLVPEYAEFLHGVVDRTYDLMDIVEDQHYIHPGFKGSSSIKKVQPVLAPDFSYKTLGVQNGTDAIEAYRKISVGELTGESVERKMLEMLEYCKNDTEVMYILWKFFKKLVEQKNSLNGNE